MDHYYSALSQFIVIFLIENNFFGSFLLNFILLIFVSRFRMALLQYGNAT